MTTAAAADERLEEVLADCVATLQQIAKYRLPDAMDRRLLWLSENQEQLSDTEREELLAVVEFAEDRTLEKLRAQTALEKLARVVPHLVPSQP